MIFKKYFKVLVIVVLFAELAGCASVRSKFIPKKKREEKPTPIIDVVDYSDSVDIKELYEKHFTYWKYWEEELIARLGENIKKQRRSFNEALVELKTFASYLKEQKNKEIQVYVEELAKLRDNFYKPYLSSVELHRIKIKLKKHRRLVEKQFSLPKMELYLIKEIEK